MSTMPNTINTMSLDDVHVCDIQQDIIASCRTSHIPDLPRNTLTYPILSDAEEQEIVVQYCNGTSICEIAKQLYLPVATIRAYLQQAGLLTTLDGNHEIPCVIVKSLG
jgi:DNA-binding NarL/FixJ family response regulator